MIIEYGFLVDAPSVQLRKNKIKVSSGASAQMDTVAKAINTLDKHGYLTCRTRAKLEMRLTKEISKAVNTFRLEW